MSGRGPSQRPEGLERQTEPKLGEWCGMPPAWLGESSDFHLLFYPVFSLFLIKSPSFHITTFTALDHLLFRFTNIK